jgi:putative spermidine/putrescine transport system substrate-binding protein
MNMLTPLDFSVIDRSVLAERQLRHGNAIGAHTLSHVICYNKKKWPGEDHPKSWADFWNVQKFPGRRVLRREEVWVTEAALKADGVKDSEFYPSMSGACSAVSTASSRTSRRGTTTIRRPSS